MAARVSHLKIARVNDHFENYVHIASEVFVAPYGSGNS